MTLTLHFQQGKVPAALASHPIYSDFYETSNPQTQDQPLARGRLAARKGAGSLWTILQTRKGARPAFGCAYGDAHMTWVYTRSATLLQYAPWADIDALRNELLPKCIGALDRQELKSYAEIYRRGIDRYILGDLPHLPSNLTFRTILHKIICDDPITAQHSTDGCWDVSKIELRQYFFYATYWEKV